MFIGLIAGLLVALSLIIIATIVTVFFCLNMIYTNLRTLVPWVKTPEANMKVVLEELNLPVGSLIYDLGCGDGRFLFLAEKYGLRATGYELALYPYLKAVLSKFLRGSKIKVYRKNFLKQNLSEADAVFLFLNSFRMEELHLKLLKEVKKNAKVVSYGFKISSWLPIKVINTRPSKVYVYLITS